jgi:UDP-N-acetyl-D-galactosamine dehydrogenase
MAFEERIAVIGLGYVGLPLALALSREFDGVVGLDIDRRRIEALREGEDWTGEAGREAILGSSLRFTYDPADLQGASFFAITVPTPVDADRRPDLSALEGACELIAPALAPGALVVIESTVYPGVTEEVCGPLLGKLSGLAPGRDFKLGYSPERINPGDSAHGLEQIVKVVSGQDAETLERVAAVYGKVAKAGIHRAPSIKVAEAAKVIENTQRDLNIALMNELAIIFDRLDIPTRDVLAAARTKWNFLPFVPGLVGGHCIGVDPYYLTARAEAAGYHPEVILAGRRINDGMGAFIARRLVKMLLRRPLSRRGADRHPGGSLQGERVRHPQQPGPRYGRGAARVRGRPAGPRPHRRFRGGAPGVRLGACRRLGSHRPRCPGDRRAP